MALDTYANLKAEIKDHLDRSDLTDDTVDTLIDLAEARHKRTPSEGGIRIRDMIVRAQSSVSSRYVALPSDFLEMISYRLLTDPVTVLTELSPYEMTRHRDESTGTPKYFTVHEEVEFDRSPDSALTSEMLYYKTLTPLSSNDTTNALLDRAPDVYLYGALMAAEPFLMNDERIQMWASLYQRAADGVNGVDRRRAGPLAARPEGAVV